MGCSQLGTRQGPQERPRRLVWAILGAILSHLGVNLAHFGTNLSYFGANLGQLSVKFGLKMPSRPIFALIYGDFSYSEHRFLQYLTVFLRVFQNSRQWLPRCFPSGFSALKTIKDDSKMLPRALQDAPKTPLRAPKIAPRVSKILPGEPKRLPRGFLELPRRAQEAPRGSQEAPRGPQETILDHFGKDFGASGYRFWSSRELFSRYPKPNNC